MENKDFRRRLLDQELPVDAGAFGRVMERRKAGGTGAAWIGKGIWAAALLIATAGIGMYLQRSPIVAPDAEKSSQTAKTQDASIAQHAEDEADKTAAYPGASVTMDAQGSASVGALADMNEGAAVQKGDSGPGTENPARSHTRLRNHTGNKTGLRNTGSAHPAVQLQGGLPVKRNKKSETPDAAGADAGNQVDKQAQHDSWIALMKQPLRIHQILRSPKATIAVDFKRSGRIAQNFLQTEWMVEPGWVLKQSSAGAALRKQERFAGAAAFTARVVFSTHRGFQWVSGIRYQEWVDRFNFSQEHTSAHQRVDAYDVIIRVPGQPDRTETRYDTTQMQVTRQESYADINRYRMIGLPVAFRWSPVPDGIWYVQAGVTPSYLVYRGGSRRMSDGSVVSLADGANINRFQLHAGLSAGMRRFIAPRLAMMLEPGLGYNVTNFASNPMRQRNLQLSLSAGLMFHLSR
jgi:hypothetical protein